MKNRIPQISLLIISLFSILLIAFIFGGCGSVKIDNSVYDPKLEKLSLLQLWDMVADKEDIRQESAEIVSLQLHANPAKLVDTFSFSFYALDPDDKPLIYIVNIVEDRIDIRKAETMEVGKTRRCDIIFEEIDKLGLDSLTAGEDGLSLHIETGHGDIGYTGDNLNISELENGTLTPLDKVLFRSDTDWCTIWVYPLNSGSSTVQTTDVAAVTPEDRTQIWFLSEDLLMANEVIYAE